MLVSNAFPGNDFFVFFIPLSRKWVPNIQINSGNDLTVKMKQTYNFLGYWQSPGFNELLYAPHVNKI